MQDLKKIEEFFSINNPLPECENIMSIATGLIGNEKINSYDAFNVGISIMKKITGLNFKDLKLSKTDNVQSLLAVNSKIVKDKEEIPVDPLLLFQRICVLKKSDDELKNYLNFELSPYPLSLFDEAGIMRKTTKATFYDIFSELPINVDDVDKFNYVIDGGMMLYRVTWQTNEEYDKIFKNYLRYLRVNYGNNVVVVFDGYNANSTKLA